MTPYELVKRLGWTNDNEGDRQDRTDVMSRLPDVQWRPTEPLIERKDPVNDESTGFARI